jgi:hypothetical protein
LPFSLAIPMHHFPISSRKKEHQISSTFQFDLCQTKHSKNYGATEDAQRRQLFLATDDIIKKHNSQKNVLYQLGHNQFSDMVIWTINLVY